MEDDRISSQLRPPLSGCDFAGELCQERLLVQVQMQVLVMLPPHVLRALLQCQVLWQGNTHEAKLHFL